MSASSPLSQRQALMILSALPRLGPIRIGRLLNAFQHRAADILSAPIQELRHIEGIGPETAATIRSWSAHFDLEKEEEQLARLGADYILKGQPGYPARLAQTPGAPHGLYIRGSVPDQPCVAIVGTRRATLYGRRIARSFAAELAQAGICVVSGLARGIDGEAHEGALTNGRTLAFLGCGLDIHYPPEHADLGRRVSESGALISEYSLGRKPDTQTFPQRNRLISGASDAILVIESDAKGGSMITANYAAEQGRSVFAVPGRIDQPSSRGPHALIREGATLVTCAKDIIEEIRAQIPISRNIRPLQGELSLTSPQQGPSKPRRNAPRQEPRSGLAASLSPEENQVLGSLSEGAILHPEEIARLCTMTLPNVMSTLMLLELKHLASRRPDARYEAQASAVGR